MTDTSCAGGPDAGAPGQTDPASIPGRGGLHGHRPDVREDCGAWLARTRIPDRRSRRASWTEGPTRAKVRPAEARRGGWHRVDRPQVGGGGADGPPGAVGGRGVMPWSE